MFLASLAPAFYLGWAFYNGRLSADPLADLTHETGVWALRFICISLVFTPLRRIANINLVGLFRRMMGLFAFFYGTLHFLTWLILDRYASLIDYPGGYFSAATMRKLAAAGLEDIAKRPYITVGFTAFVLMIPLAITSTKGWIRRLGRKWSLLHRLVYLTAIGGVVHYWWLVKADITRPEIYAAIVAVLLGARVWLKVRLKADTTSRPSARRPASARDPQSARG